MARNVAYALQVISGPNASDEVRLGIAPTTIGNGPRDTIRVFDEGVLNAHLRIFAKVDETDPDSDITGWGFAYQSGVAIKNSADDARFGDIVQGLIFDIGSSKIKVVAAADAGAAVAPPPGELSKPMAIGLMFLGLALFLGWFGWLSYSGSAAPSNRIPSYLTQAASLRAATTLNLPELDACLSAPLVLADEEQDEVVPGTDGYTFHALRNETRGTPKYTELRETLMADLKSRYLRAALFHQTGNFDGVRAELQSIVDLLPVAPNNADNSESKCKIVNGARRDLTTLPN